MKQLFKVGRYTLSVLIAFLLGGLLQRTISAQAPKDVNDSRDRITIQEKLLYAYAYAYDSKDCVSFANLFTADGTLNWQVQLTGRDAIRQGCITRQENVVSKVKTHHYVTNIVFDELTANEAKTRSYVLLTWEKPGDKMPSIQGV